MNTLKLLCLSAFAVVALQAAGTDAGTEAMNPTHEAVAGSDHHGSVAHTKMTKEEKKAARKAKKEAAKAAKAKKAAEAAGSHVADAAGSHVADAAGTTAH